MVRAAGSTLHPRAAPAHHDFPLILVSPTGFEPTTSSSARMRSIQLSYGPTSIGGKDLYVNSKRTGVIVSFTPIKDQMIYWADQVVLKLSLEMSNAPGVDFAPDGLIIVNGSILAKLPIGRPLAVLAVKFAVP